MSGMAMIMSLGLPRGIAGATRQFGPVLHRVLDRANKHIDGTLVRR